MAVQVPANPLRIASYSSPTQLWVNSGSTLSLRIFFSFFFFCFSDYIRIFAMSNVLFDDS